MPIDINESNQSLSEKNIKPTFNDSEMLDSQDITTSSNNKTKACLLEKNIRLAFNINEMFKDKVAFTTNKTKAHSNTKKVKNIDYNAPINVDDSNPTLSKKNITQNINRISKTQDMNIQNLDIVAPTNNKIKACSNAKKGKNINHNTLINVDDSDPTLPERNINLAQNISRMFETQDMVASTNNKTKAYKPNGNSKKAKKEKQVYHNASINVDDNDPTLLEKNIGT
ncbi:88_t:CDS:2 [Racocetra persica]|uniref:88_t:CDS:1 n=1 Tax=Racocetra persica TaxID=160502 RepID=A0ACA9LCM8_9GLOM|nr:88_t:CDS:2 [Racocetra persica]